MGMEEYVDLSRDFHVPIVVGGFEPVDLLEAISMLVAQLEEGRAEVENQYARSVAREGNCPAQEIMAKVFEVCDRKWRGIGSIPRSGLKLREEFAAFDAEKVFDVAAQATDEPAECISASGAAGLEEASGLPRVWRALHARESAGRAHGFVGGSMRGLLSVPTAFAKLQDGCGRGD